MRRLITICLAAILIFAVQLASGQKRNFEEDQRRQQEQWEEFSKEGALPAGVSRGARVMRESANYAGSHR